VTAANICERPLAYRLAHEIKYTIVFVRDAGFLSPSGADQTDRRTILRATDRHAACQRTATANMDPFPILRAGAFVTSLAGVVHSSPSIFLSPTQYTTTRVSFSHVRARYGPHFERAVRMSDGAFHALVGILRPRLPRRGLSAEVRTALALRYMGSGSYVDMCAAFGVHSASVYRAVWDVVDAVNCSPALALDFQVEDCTRRAAYAARFKAQRNSPFGNIIGALDGIAVQQEQPLATDVTCVADYYSRKGFYALNVQAICDADYKFRWMSCKSPGSAHDSSAFTGTNLGQALLHPENPLAARLIQVGHCIAADEAYAASEVLAVPWPGGGKGDRWRDSYNFYLSSSRIHIEQAFGMLVWRWGVFWRPLRVPFVKRPGLVRACFRLHNFCRDHSMEGVAPLGYDRSGGSVFFSSNDAVSSDQRGRRRDRERSLLRVRMTERVEELGLVRPGVAPMH